MEDKYVNENHQNLVKLESFKKKIFAIGIIEDVFDNLPTTSNEQKRLIAKNSMLIRNLIKDVKPENVVLELD